MAKLWAMSTISYLKMISASSSLCSLADPIFFIPLFVAANSFSTPVTRKSQVLNLFVWVSAEIGFFPNIRQSFAKFLICVSPISFIDLIPSNIKSGTTIESLFILCSFVNIIGFLGNFLNNVLMSNSKFLQKMSLSSWCFVERALLLIVFLLTPETLWWFWQYEGHMFPNESVMNHHVCWLNLLPDQLIWLPCCFACALGQEPFLKILYLTFERKKNLS